MQSPSASYSLTVRLEITNKPGMLGKVTSAIGKAGGDIGAIDLVEVGKSTITRDLTFKASDEPHGQQVVDRSAAVRAVKVVNVSDRTFLMHLGGKIEVQGKMSVKTRDDLSMAYTPGVARVCMAIHHDPEKAYTLTIKQNTVAVVTDGTAVLGLGDIGPAAAAPVMEGKALIFKEFAGVDAFPICLATKDVDEIVMIVKAIAPIFGGINLEDISAPRCFEIEERLQRDLDIPVFHDDQHGTAVVVLAAMINALKLVKKKMADVRIVFTGAGASGIATAKLLMKAGAKHIIGCDRAGAIYKGRTENMNSMKEWFAKHTNPKRLKGTAGDALEGRRRLHRAVGPGRGLAEGHQGHEPGRDRLRHGQPGSRDPAGRGRPVRARHGHRPLGLSEPDQQLVLLPRHLPRHARRAGPARERRDEAGGGARDRRDRGQERAQRGVHHAVDVRRRVVPAVSAAVADAAIRTGVARARRGPPGDGGLTVAARPRRADVESLANPHTRGAMAQPKVTADLPIEALLREKRKFPPPKAFVKHAVVNKASIYAEAARNPVRFWEERARELHWFKPWKKALEWKPPYAKWFVGGKLNVAYNCLDRHVAGPRQTKAALIWEGEPGDTRTLTYWDLYREVQRFAAALKRHGVRKGDRVTIYMPMVPEVPIAMLACARIGAAHSVIFGGFSPEVGARPHPRCRIQARDHRRRRLAARARPCRSRRTPTRRCEERRGVETVIVLKRTGQPIDMQSGRDIWWDDFVKGAAADCPAEPMDSEDLLYLLYTSGSTGKPKGIIHTTGGYLHRRHGDPQVGLRLHEEDVYWCTADVGWVTGHSYVVYGPLANGATTVMYEGTPDFPDKDRFWRIIEKHGVTICYTAPTAIRTFMRWGEEYPKRCDLSSLRLLGTVGEPINPEAWVWYWKVIGGRPLPGRRHVVADRDRPHPHHAAARRSRCSSRARRPGRSPASTPRCSTSRGSRPKAGYLVLRKPWPGMLRGIWGDPDRFVKQYWSKYDDIYFTGDGAKRDEDGYFWLLGRVDDVMNVSGHRVSTMEVESALVDHKSVAEAAVIGKTHEIKGQAIAAFVTVKSGVDGSPALMDELKEHVAKKIGALARPDDIIFSAELPKTRSRQDHAPPAARHRRGPGARRHDHAGRPGRRRVAQDQVRGTGGLASEQEEHGQGRTVRDRSQGRGVLPDRPRQRPEDPRQSRQRRVQGRDRDGPPAEMDGPRLRRDCSFGSTLTDPQAPGLDSSPMARPRAAPAPRRSAPLSRTAELRHDRRGAAPCSTLGGGS